MAFMNNESGTYAANIVQDAAGAPVMDAAFKQIYDKFAQRICWIDGQVVPGSFQMNTSWYHSTPAIDPIFAEHSHPGAEILGFFGTDSENPSELDADIEVIIDGEAHSVTRSTLVFFPPNVPHALRILRVGKPIFHFSVVTDGTYNGAAYK